MFSECLKIHDENTNIKIKFSHKTMLYVYKTVQHNAITKKKNEISIQASPKSQAQNQNSTQNK